MEELKDILMFLNTNNTEETEHARDLLREFIESSAYVVPKCPKCKSNQVSVGHEYPGIWYLNCEGCDEWAAERTDLPEALKAFGNA